MTRDRLRSGSYDGHNRKPQGLPMRVIRWRRLRRRMHRWLRRTAEGPDTS